MVKCVIDLNNFDQLLQNIKNSSDTVFDFSGTNFAALGSTKLSAVFVALGSLSHPFSLKLNYCQIGASAGQLDELMLGLSTTQNMRSFEFFRAHHVSEKVLLKIAESLSRNYGVASIKVDGVRVTPTHICEILTTHPHVQILIVDGLLKVNKTAGQSQFFKSKTAANEEAISENVVQEDRVKQKRGGG